MKTEIDTRALSGHRERVRAFNRDMIAMCKQVRGKHSRKYPIYRMIRILDAVAQQDRAFALAWMNRRAAPARFQKHVSRVTRVFDEVAKWIARHA